MTPFDQADELDFVLLGTARSPGIVTLTGHDRLQSWDVQAAKGQVGATSTLNGPPIGTFRAAFYLASDSVDAEGDDDFDRWERFQALLEAMVFSPTPAALPIYHPDLARNHFTEVSVKSISGLVHDGRGGATVSVEFIEYRPPKPKPAAKAKAKAGGSVARSGKTSGGAVAPAYDPNARAKATLAGLLEEARKP